MTNHDRTSRWLKRLGAGAFLFFLLKGLGWLALGGAGLLLASR